MKNQTIFLGQVYHLTLANMKSRYRKTFAGFIWVILNPIMLYGAQSMVFRKFLRLDIPDFFTFLFSGLLPWIFITQTAYMSTPIFVTQGSLLKSMKIHPLVILMSQILDNFINFMVTFIILFIPIWLRERTDSFSFIFLPLGLVILIGGVIGLCWFLSTLNIFYRDTNYVVSFVISIMFFLTPIFYPIHYIPQEYRWIVNANPIYGLIRPIRSTLYQFNSGSMISAFVQGTFWMLGLLALAYFYWKKKKEMIYYHV